MRKGGYELGYKKCDCFWGDAPAGLVIQGIELLEQGAAVVAADFGCGEGKNAQAMASAGFHVVAFEISPDALTNAQNMYPESPVAWVQKDITELVGPPNVYDMVIATGSLHCLRTPAEIQAVVSVMQLSTKVGGINVISSFNSGPQDLNGHDEGFEPTLMGHQEYLELYRSWDMIEETNAVQNDRHPNNEVEHFHSITRLLARKT